MGKLSERLHQLLRISPRRKTDPFPYPDELLRGFNQLLIACTVQEVDHRQTPKSIPEFVEQWAVLPLAAWPLTLETVESFGLDDYLIEPDTGAYPTQLCKKLAQRRV